MKQELLKKITPIIEDFVDDILKSFGDIDKIRKDLIDEQRHYQDLVETKDKELADAKKQKALDKHESDKKITDLENAKEDFKKKAQSYEDLSHELKVNKKEIDDSLEKAKMELIRSKDARAQSEKIREDADRIRKDYELKLSSLKKDFDYLQEENKKRDIDNKKSSIREEEIFKNETRQNQRAQELNDQDLKIKFERKEIDRLIKRYNLENALKGT